MQTDLNNPGSVAERYLELLADEPRMRLALLVSAAALRLDDATAVEAIQAVAPVKEATEAVVWRLKKLSCVLPRWDGTWRLAEDVRPHLLQKLEQELGADSMVKLRRRLAARAQQAVERCPPNGQITSYRRRQAQWEAGYQQTLIPEKTQDGARQLVDVWREAAGSESVREATCRAADYLTENELKPRLGHLPAQLLFLQGMAARARGDHHAEERYFRAVWEQGEPGDIYGIAAHLFGVLVSQRDRKTAEQAMRDSLTWYKAPHHRGHVEHSLGNLLSKRRDRWEEAEEAYQASLELNKNPHHQGQVRHSLGNLLSKQPQRWEKAEEAYKQSLRLLEGNEASQGKTWHSLGNLLSKQSWRWKEAERAYERSIDLLQTDEPSQGTVWHSLGNLLSKQSGRWEEAEEAYERSLGLLESDPPSQGKTWHSLGNLLRMQSGRWEEAEKSYERSMDLLEGDEPSQGEVYASWARAIFRKQETSLYEKAEEYALKALQLKRDSLKHKGIVHSLLARIYETKSQYSKAISSLEEMIQANRKLKNWGFVSDGGKRLRRLREIERQR